MGRVDPAQQDSAERREERRTVMSTQTPGHRLAIDLEYASHLRYRCHPCRRAFTIAFQTAQGDAEVRCPQCGGDDVRLWLRRRDRLTRFLMFYEAA